MSMATPRQLFHPSLPYPDVVAAALAIPVGVVRLNPVLRFIQHARAVHNAVLICETVGVRQEKDSCYPIRLSYQVHPGPRDRVE